MQLTDKDIESFQALYKKQFNKDISRAEALAKGTQLLILMKAVYKPMTQEEHDSIQKHRKDTMPQLIQGMIEDESNPTVTYADQLKPKPELTPHSSAA
jgi:hypothetical protein